jgi:DNA processing protein
VIWERGAAEYPGELLDLSRPPARLHALGNPEALTAPRVSIVGTRQSTAYGERVTRSLTTTLVRAGVCVISGMARGIDGIAHRTALDSGGRTVAVLGTGVDVPYPAGHRQLHRMIVERGLVLSENPPGMTAHQGAFPKRNRLIAALAPLTIVVEAGRRSGALNTAGQALELGRTVAAVPGPIDSPQSLGSNELLRDGAVMIATTDDALTLLGVALPKQTAEVELPESERRLWDCLRNGPTDVDRLALQSGLALGECLAGVSALEIRGLVQCSLAGEISRI